MKLKVLEYPHALCLLVRYWIALRSKKSAKKIQAERRLDRWASNPKWNLYSDSLEVTRIQALTAKWLGYAACKYCGSGSKSGAAHYDCKRNAIDISVLLDTNGRDKFLARRQKGEPILMAMMNVWGAEAAEKAYIGDPTGEHELDDFVVVGQEPPPWFRSSPQHATSVNDEGSVDFSKFDIEVDTDPEVSSAHHFKTC